VLAAPTLRWHYEREIESMGIATVPSAKETLGLLDVANLNRETASFRVG
jgi:hypothetical protein